MLFVNWRVFLIHLAIYAGAFIFIGLLNCLWPFGYTWGHVAEALELSLMGVAFYAGVRLVAWLLHLDFFIVRFIAFMVIWASPYMIINDSDVREHPIEVPGTPTLLIGAYGLAAFIAIWVLYKRSKTVAEKDSNETGLPPLQPGEEWAETDPDEDDYLLRPLSAVPFDDFPTLLLKQALPDGEVKRFRIVPDIWKKGSSVSLQCVDGQTVSMEVVPGSSSRQVTLSFYQTCSFVPYMRLADDKAVVYLNGKRCAPNHKYRIFAGDVIRLGRAELEVQMIKEEEEESSAPESDRTEEYSSPYCPSLPELTLTRRFANGREFSCSVTPEGLLQLPEQVAIIGRAGDAHVRFTDRSISLRHFRLGCDASGYWIEDEGSENGTKVNGVVYSVCQRVWLNDGDCLQLGNAVLEVRIPEKDDDGTEYRDADSADHTVYRPDRDERTDFPEPQYSEPWMQEYVEAWQVEHKGSPEDYIPRLVLGNLVGVHTHFSRTFEHEELVKLPGKVAVLGSADDAYITLKAAGVASYHLTIGSDYPGQFWIKDNGSPGGTYIDGVRCEPHRPYQLRGCERIRLGELEIVTELDYNAKYWT